MSVYLGDKKVDINLKSQVGDSVDWNDVVNKPDSYNPSAHLHAQYQTSADVKTLINASLSAIELSEYYKKNETSSSTQLANEFKKYQLSGECYAKIETSSSVQLTTEFKKYQLSGECYAKSETSSSTQLTTEFKKYQISGNYAKTLKLSTLEASSDSNGNVDISKFFSTNNPYLVNVLPYPINTTGSILDRNINVVTSGSFTIPSGFKDLLIRYNGSPISLSFAESNITDYGDDLPEEDGKYLITVTRIGSYEAYVRVVTLEERN